MSDRSTVKSGLIRKLNLLYEQVKNVERYIAERSHSEQALKKSEKRYRDLFENANDAIFLVDAELNFIDANRKAVELLGYSRAQLLKMKVLDQIPKDQRHRSAEEFKKLRKEGKYEKFRGKMKTRDGRWLDIEVSSSAIFEGKKYSGSRDIVRDITEQVRTEESLRESEARLKEAQRIALVGDWEWEIATNKVHWSEELYRIYGYEPREIAPDFDLVVKTMHPESKTAFLNGIDAAVKVGRPFEMDYRFFRKDGSAAVLHTIGQVIRDSSGTPASMKGIVQDITGRKQTEDSLLLFKNLLNQSMDAIFVNDPATGTFLIVNDKACSNLGYDRSKLLTLRTLDIEATFPDQAAWDAHVNEVRRKGYLILEGMNKRSDGTLFPVEVNVTYGVLGGKDYMVAVVRDITERKLSERALRSSEERLSRAQKMAHVGNWEKNLVTGHLQWSEEIYRIHGVNPARFIPTTDAVLAAIHPEDLEPFKKALHEAVHEQKNLDMDYRIIRPDGTIRTIHTIGEVIYDQSGRPLMHSGTIQDITDRKLADERLSQSEKSIRTILDTVDEGFIVIDREYRIMNANKAYCDQVGRTCESIIGKYCYETSHKSERPCHENGEECPVRYVFATGEPYTALHRHPDAADNIQYVEAKAFPIKDASGAVISVIEVVNNITEKHLLEEVRLKSQKLEAIGTLAGGIAHDFNNLLQGVFGYIYMAKTIIGEKERSLSMLEQAEQALHLCVNLTKQLLTFSKGGMPIKRPVSIGEVIENSARFALSGSRAEYRIMLDPDLWLADADEGQISQAIQNIVLNADQAMPQGGTVVITARNVELPKKADLHLLEEGRYIEIAIQDTGAGIPERYLQKIFDPYFTTKPNGSGLGLATSYSIVKNHGGMINVVTEVNKGTTFFLYLPAVEPGVESQPETAAPARSLRKGKILVMDDDELVREISVEMLHACGHDVELAEHGEEAITKYQSARVSGCPFDVIILDLTIRGGLGGKETITRLREIDPAVKAIVSSGYSDDTVVSEFPKYGFKARLAKPYQFRELRDTVNQLLS